jgi:NADPH-dependent curcumin reductase CurA
LKKSTVVGVTSSQEKSDYLTKELGYDHAFIYNGKSKDQLISEIKEKFPDGIDSYFDIVGGDISCAIYSCMKNKGTVFTCGQSSRYHDSEFNLSSFSDLSEECKSLVKERSLKVKRFVINDYSEKFEEAFNDLYKNFKGDEIMIRETAFEGINKWSEAFVNLFEGEHLGREIVQVKMEEERKIR